MLRPKPQPDLSFDEIDKNILKNQIIDESSPGTILRDFNSLLDYIESNTIEATKSKYHFSMKHLRPINEQFTHPIKIGINRPQQQAFPNIGGLYLLLRSIELLDIKRAGKKNILILDKKILQSWNSLNPTERYFTLLEAWLLRGDPREILKERSARGRSLLDTCLGFWKRIPAKGLKIEGNSEIDNIVQYAYGFYNMALLELLGLLEIQHGEPKIGEGWRVLSVKRNDFGDAILRYLLQIDSKKNFWDFEFNKDIPIKELQPFFQPFFPEWQNNLSSPGTKTEFRDGTYLFKVSLGKTWKRIEIPGEMTLEDLTDIILDAYEFDKDHLYSFYYKDRFGNTVEINCPDIGDEPDTIDQIIGEIPIQIGTSMKFEYDFGENWVFEILLEKINPVDKEMDFPNVIEEYGEPPSQYPNWDEDE